MRIIKGMRWVIAVAGGLVLSLQACDIDWSDFAFDIGDYQYRYDETFESALDGVETVEIKIVNGPINVSTWDRDSIRIDVDKRIKAGEKDDAEEMAREVRLESRKAGSALVIEPDWGDHFGRRGKFYFGLEVRVPARIAVNLKTTNGGIETVDLESTVQAETTNGGVRIEGAKGDIVLSTTNGAIYFRGAGGSVRASSTNGRVEGEITGPLGGDVRMGTTNGGISIRIAGSVGYRIDARTTNGTVNTDLSSAFKGEFNRRRTSLHGESGDGRYRIELSTTNGSIDIEER